MELAGSKIPPSQGSGGKSVAVVDAVIAHGLFAPGTGLGTTQVESRSRIYFWLPMGALKQAQPFCKHMFTGVGRVKTARVLAGCINCGASSAWRAS